MKIEAGTHVTITYELRDTEGNVVESGSEEEPIRYRHGDGELPPGLEGALEGATEGDELVGELSPEEAYGPYDPGALFMVPREELPPDLEPDDWVEIHASGEDDEGNTFEDEAFEARVTKLNDDEAVLDANHPLAGQSITFRVRVLSLSRD